AAITRNSYGALVLNADEMMFVDIDRRDLLRPGHTMDPVLEEIGGVVERHGLSARVYRTAAGHRAIITSRKFQAGSAEAEALLQEFGADPMYVRLCRLQASFRARLTPKPWRCNFYAPPVEFPFETPQAEEAFRRWDQEYNRQAAGFATCQFVAVFGHRGDDP